VARLLMQIALVSIGSTVGGLARWGVAEACSRLLGTASMWGTLFVNLTGSFFIGWFLTVMEERLPFDGYGWLSAYDFRLLVAVGFTGTYTTFSTFEYEGHRLLADGANLAGLTYLGGSVFLGLLAVHGGVLLARLH
jgi:fluoride exporter